MSRVRLAVIGAGHLGRIHARLARSLAEFELVAVVDPIAAAREAIAAEHQTRACESHLEVTGQIDAAIVATPTNSHHAVAHDLLSRGIHCLVEKPLTLCAADADDLLTAADRSHCVLQVGHVERFNPAFLAGRSVVEQPQFIEAVRAAPYTFRSTDVSVVLDLMIHDIDLALALAQSEVRRVDAIGGKIIGPNEDWAQARLTFASGAVASLLASRIHPSVQRTLQVVGGHGMLWLDFQAKTAKTMQRSDDGRDISGKQRSIPPVDELPTVENNAILEELREFANAIRFRVPVTASGRAGRAAVAVAEEVLTTLAAAHPTSLPPAIIPFMPFHVPIATPRRKAA
jgi:predicted dehydrogenase